MDYNEKGHSLRVALFLTFIGGFLEIYSFLLKGKVFATTITGNIILMIYNVFNLNLLSIPKYLVPIISFCTGIVLVEYLKTLHIKKQLHFKELILIFEMFIIIYIFIFRSEYFNILTTSLISFISAIQIQTFKKARNAIYMSTMCTGNTRKLIESIVSKNYEHTKIFGSLISAFSFGVIFGSILIQYLHEASILFLLIPLLILFYLVRNDN